ncbi:MAG: hypothetical protein ACLR1T_03485 [Evtepia gabavorous]
MIQTWTPDNDVINLAARQDYDTFYEEEREMRRMPGSPLSGPVSDYPFRSGGDPGSPCLRSDPA